MEKIKSGEYIPRSDIQKTSFDHSKGRDVIASKRLIKKKTPLL